MPEAGALLPSPRYSRGAVVAGAWRTSRNARAETDVVTSRVRPSHCSPREVELGVAAGLRALAIGFDPGIARDQEVRRQAEHGSVGLEDQVTNPARSASNGWNSWR